MIDKEHGKFILECAMCGIEEVFDTFDEAVDFMKKEGWVSENERWGWIEICPEC